MKCYWSIIVWIWCGGQAKIAKDEDVIAELKLRQSQSKTRRRITIQRKNNADAGKVLGVQMNMRGTWKIDVDRWIGISKSFACRVKRGRFDRTCGLKIYQFIWVPKFRYSASIIGYSKSQVSQIEKQVTSACLSASGLNR